jgi:predicted GH43/DUF377 family glycosyl hydrolase
MKWIKKGILYKPNSKFKWQNSHAALPSVIHLNDDIYRVFFTSRDSNNHAYVGFFDWEIGVPGKIINISNNPVLSPGKWGYFDDHGCQATSVVQHNNKFYMYYLGWNVGEPNPLFYTSIGVAISDDGINFNKYSKSPILSRSEFDPWMVSGGTVLCENGLWRMYYLSGMKFEWVDNKPRSFYDIKIARSKDGINWDRNGEVALALAKNESNISRLSIIKENGKYFAWYPVKKTYNKGYRVGYAESDNGEKWQRKDNKVGIDVSPNSWDSESIDKMEVISHKGTKYMLYNGNQFGKDGIGLAVLKNG